MQNNMATESSSKSAIDLLHPEILSTETLLSVLKERRVKGSEFDGLDKYKLVQLFYDYVMPLPQRIYGKGRRAKKLEIQRSESEKATKNALPTESNSKEFVVKEFRMSTNDKSTNGNRPVKNSLIVNKVVDQQRNRVFKKDEKSKDADEIPAKKRKHQPITWP